MDISHFEPSAQPEEWTLRFRFKFSGAGLFQCNVTGVVFVTTGEGDVSYKVAIWWDRYHDPSGRSPTGPLYDIQCPQNVVSQLHLPHCEVTPTDLSVAHVTDEAVELLQPESVSDSYVVVNVDHLSEPSLFGIVERGINFFQFTRKSKPKHVQALVFLQESWKTRSLSVVMLPRNVPTALAKRSQDDARCVCISKCVLLQNQTYSLSVLNCPSAFAQPKAPQYLADHGPNYHPMFLVSMDADEDNFTLKLTDPNSKIIWEEDISLGAQPTEPAAAAAGSE